MLGTTYPSAICSAARALEVVGERWTLLIVRKALFARATRFKDFSTLGVSTNILQKRLDSLVDHGVMKRVDGPGRPEYHLTDRGLDLLPVVIALTAWGDRWAAPDGEPVHYTDRSDGGRVGLELRCSNDGHVVAPADVIAMPGPGMPSPIAERLRAMHDE